MNVYVYGSFLLLGISLLPSVQGYPDGIGVADEDLEIRKEIRSLTTAELQRLSDVWTQMRTNRWKDTDLSEYDYYVQLHCLNNFAGHGGAAFLPWHREFLRRFEKHMQRYDPTITIPYWDNLLDQRSPLDNVSAIFTPRYFGEREGEVVTGLSAGWRVLVTDELYCDELFPTTTLTRGTLEGGRLMRDKDHNKFFSLKNFGDLIDSHIELHHNLVHLWVGGHMGMVPCATNDVIFWLTHTYVDCLWEEFRQEVQINNTDIYHDYPSSWQHGDDIGGHKHEPHADMKPFEGMVNRDGLKPYGYKCATRPSKIRCEESSDCGDPNVLLCDLYDHKCKAKVKAGGPCDDYGVQICDCTYLTDTYAECFEETCICKPNYTQSTE